MVELVGKKGLCFGVILAGAGMMSVAMFLHPMSPEDFLDQVVSDPLQTVVALQGSGAAALFWVGSATAATGIAGLAVRVIAALRRGSHFFAANRLPAH